MDNDEKMKYMYNWDNFLSLVCEGLIRTFPIKTVLKLLTNNYSVLKMKVSTEIDESTDTIFIKGESIEFYNKDIIKLFRLLTICGYFPSTFKFYDDNDKLISILIYKNINDEFLEILNDNIFKSTYCQITIESKFNRIINVPNEIYHVTNSKIVHKIFKNGLISKNKNKRAYHTERIYFGFNKIITKNLAYQFDEKTDYSLLKINTQNINAIFYDDPDFTNYGCYTYDNISPDKITVIDNFKNYS